jgi:hypothetical protein
MRKVVAMRFDRSMSTLTTLALPSSSWATASTSGATVLQGAHQVAVNSTSTGSSLRSTSRSNSCSLISGTAMMASS